MAVINWKSGINGDWGTAADWSNGMVPGAATDVSIAATGTYTVTISAAEAAHSLSINAAGATVSDNSSLTIGTTLTLSAGTFALGSSGDLAGGTVKVGSQGHVQLNGGTLTGVTWLGSLTFGASQTLFVNDGLSVPGASGTGNGAINLSAGNDTLFVEDSETLNNATLTFGGGSNGSLETFDTSPSVGQTLTLGSGFTVTQTGGSNSVGDGDYGEALVNNGLISVSGGTFSVNNAGFSNAGSIALSGGLFQAGSGIANSGMISVTGGTFDLTTSLAGSGTLALSSKGVLELGGNAVLSGTVAASGGTFDPGSGTLSAVAWQGPLALAASQTVFVENGLSVTGTGGTGNGTINLSAGNDTLYVLDTETLNNATLTFGSGSNGSLETFDTSPSVGQTLTLGSGFTVSQTGGSNYLGDGDYNATLVNDGLISVSGGTFSVNNAGFSNAGSIALSGGLLQAGSGIANSGMISVTGGIFDLTTSLTGSGTLALSSKGELELGSNAVLSGTVASSGGTFNPGSGTLSSVTWDGALTIGASQSLYVVNGLSVTGTSGSGNGAISLSAGGAFLYVLDNETLNNQTLNFGSASNDYFGLYEGSSFATQTLTLGTGFSTTQSGGTNYFDGDSSYANGLLINQGTIGVSGGNLVDDQYIGGFTNIGVIGVSAGTFTADNVGTFVNSGSIDLSGGTFTAESGVFTNSGSILVSGGTFDLESGVSSNGGSISITGGTFDLQSTLTSPGALSVSGSGVFELDGSGVIGGVVTPGGGAFDFNGGTLSAATWHGPLTIGANQTAFVENGLFVTGTSGSGNGTINMSTVAASLVVLDTETLNNATLTFGSGTNNSLCLYGASSTQTVTLGGGFTLSQAEGSNSLSDYDNSLGSLVNAGLISLSGGTLGASGLATFANTGTIAVTGATFTASSINSFTSSGLIALSTGGTLDLSGVTKFTNLAGTTLSGTYSVGTASAIELANNVFVTMIAGKVSLSGAGSSIQSYNSNTGSQITLDSKLTTIAAGGMLSVGAGRAFSGAAAFADNGAVTLAGSSFTEKSVTIAAAASFSGTGTLTGALTNNGRIEATTGALVLASAVSGTGALQIDSGATLEAKSSSSAGETVTYGGIGAVLKLDAPAGFASIISGLAPGNVIDFVKTTLTGVSSTGTLLSAASASGTTTLTLAATLKNEHLGLSSDGSGGTNITAYALAQSSAHTPEPVVFGNHHVGDSVSTAVTLTNTATPAAYSEGLDASIAAASGAATGAGSFTALAAGASNGTSLLVGLNSASAGALSGTDVITLASDGAGLDTAGTTSLGTQIVNVSGAVYAYAQVSVANNGTVTLANTHVGQAVSGTLAVSNGAAANGYSEALDGALGGAGSGVSAGGSFSGLSAGAGTSLAVGYTASAGGSYAGTATLSLVSDGTGIDGLGTTTLAPRTVTVTGAAYAYASGTLSSNTVSLAITHVGQADSAALTLTNGAPAGGYSEALDAGLSGASASIAASGSIIGLEAGTSDMSSLLVGLNTSSSGSFAGTVVLGLVSDGNGIDGLGTTTLTGQTISVMGIVDNYAVAALQDPGGPALAGTSRHETLNLGSVVQGGAVLSTSLGVLNAATGLSDLLVGSISVAGGSGFTNSGFGSFSGLSAGAGEAAQKITLATSTAGTFTETIVLSSAGTNASGYDGALATETLTVFGTVTPSGYNTYTLALGPNDIIGANSAGDIFKAVAGSVNSRDQLTGGSGANTLSLVGGGLFDVNGPSVFANIPTITASEGQAAFGTLAATNQVLLLRDGVGETVNVAAGHAAAGNSNAEQISIYGGTGADTINLASGSDTVYLGTGSETVVLGGAENSVFAGGGSSVVQSVAAYAGASVVGTSTGSLALDITSAGTVTLNAADTDMSVQLGAKVKLTLGKLGFITVNGGNGGDTIVAGAANQTLIGGAADVLTGFAGGGDVFSGASAALSGDTLGNWTTGDVIDLTDMSASATLSYAGTTKSGKLTVSDGVHSSVISFSGSFTAANFGSPISDGQNGVLIGYHG